MAAKARCGPGGNQKPELHPGLLCGWQRPKYLGHLPVLFKAHRQEARSEVANPGLELALLYRIPGLQMMALLVIPQCQPHVLMFYLLIWIAL